MNTTNEHWGRIECGHCKWFKANADMENIESNCKRLDHKHLRFAKKIFKCYDCGQREQNICSDFYPNNTAKWLKLHWEEVSKQIIPYSDKDVISLNIDGDVSVRYAVKATDFYNNTFTNKDGSLRWVYKYYQRRSRESVTGYLTIYETPDGTVGGKEVIRNVRQYWEHCNK